MDRRRGIVLAWSAAGITLLLALIGIVLFVLSWGTQQPLGGFGTRGVALLAAVAAAGVGLLVALRHPANPTGWLLLAMGPLGFCSYELPILYAQVALFARPGSLPGGEVAAWLSGWIWGIGLIVLGLMFLFFPDGSLPSPRWRSMVYVLIASWLWAGWTTALQPGPVDTFRQVENPFAGPSANEPLVMLATFIAFASIIACALSLVPRYRGADAEQRAQIRWVMAAGLFVGVAYLAYMPIYVAFGRVGPDPPIVDLAETVVFLSLASVPVSIGVAILKYRLYDIDLVINKAVVFSILAAFITVVYVGVVVGVGALVGSAGNAVLSAIAAALVALAFQPVRRVAQRVANHLVYGQRATPYDVLHRFSERVAGSYGTEDVLPRMVAILGEGTGAARTQVWMKSGPELRPVAAWPAHAERSRALPLRGGELPVMDDVSLAAPVQDRGELLGALSLTKDRGDPITPTEQGLVEDLAFQAGLVLRNVRLVEDLRASRGRLVAAQDAERRRIERNIHDGAQQQLVALSVKARLAEAAVGADEERARALLREIATDTQDSLESLRDLARGIYPPLLADQGLAAALGAQARKGTLPVFVHADGVGRYRPEIEATVYFCVLEALQNAAKYSEAGAAEISLRAADGTLVFEVSDDGLGFDPASAPRGSGLQNMSDRLEAVGGSLEIHSSPGAGTTLRARIPLAGGSAD